MCVWFFSKENSSKTPFLHVHCRTGGQVRSVEVSQCSPKMFGERRHWGSLWYSWQTRRGKVSLRRGNNTRATGYKTYDQPVVGTSRPARTSLRNILRRHVTKIRSLNIFMAKMLHILLRNISIANLFRHVQFRKLFTFEILYENKIANLSIQLPQWLTVVSGSQSVQFEIQLRTSLQKTALIEMFLLMYSGEFFISSAGDFCLTLYS